VAAGVARWILDSRRHGSDTARLPPPHRLKSEPQVEPTPIQQLRNFWHPPITSSWLWSLLPGTRGAEVAHFTSMFPTVWRKRPLRRDDCRERSQRKPSRETATSNRKSDVGFRISYTQCVSVSVRHSALPRSSAFSAAPLDQAGFIVMHLTDRVTSCRVDN
jgi:hypothetical protein